MTNGILTKRKTHHCACNKSKPEVKPTRSKALTKKASFPLKKKRQRLAVIFSAKKRKNFLLF
jgi:hypothetical protein